VLSSDPATSPLALSDNIPSVTLGYNGVVERCDSVDFAEIDFDDMHNGGSPKNKKTGPDSPVLMEMPSNPVMHVPKTRSSKISSSYVLRT